MSCYFITLTLNQDDGNVYKEHIQKFIKSLRKRQKLPLKYYAIGEYGGKFKRPHYHVILFYRTYVDFNEMYNQAQQAWSIDKIPLGFITVGEVNEARSHYITHHHVNKLQNPDGTNPCFSLMSRNPCIAYDYTKNMAKWHRDTLDRAFVYDFSGNTLTMPRYIKNKIYSPLQIAAIGLRAKEKFKDLVDADDWLKYHKDKTMHDYYKYLAEYMKDLQTIKLNKLKNKNKFI